MSKNGVAEPTPMAIGIRAWTRSLQKSKRRQPRRAALRASEWTFVFDTETTVDAAQQLRIGCFRVLRAGRLEVEGLFHDRINDPERALVERIADEAGLIALDMPTFRNWFFQYAYRLRATVVGHNLPFDLSRLAIDWKPARGRFKGGFSFVLWPRTDGPGENRFRPRLRIKVLNSRGSLIEFAATAQDDRDGHEFWPGRFVDTRTLAAALTDKALSLDAAAEIFDTEDRKLGEAAHGEPLTERYIDYLRRDVLVTDQLYRKLLEEFERHPIDLDPSRAYSSASIGKAYLKAFGITPPAERSKVPDEVLGYAMSAFYGGRVECRIRKELVPVTYIDVRSMYPSVFTLLGLQRFLLAEELACEEATDDVRELVQQISASDLFDPEAWTTLHGICEIEPDGSDLLPVRAKYGDSATRSIGFNFLESPDPLWYSLPDVVASKLLTGRDPVIRRAFRFVPRGRLSALQPLRLRGQVGIDPRSDEIFKRVIEERERLAGNDVIGIAEREARRRFLKTFANGTSYGILAELNRQEPTRRPRPLRVFAERSFGTQTLAPELPGRYCFPPLAVLITGAARLVLALLEHEVVTRGGRYAFCDTDSMAIVTDYSEAGASHALSQSARNDALSLVAVEEIIQSFERLCPFEVGGSLFKVEDENFADRSRAERRPLFVWAVSAKRYALLNIGPTGRLTVRRYSEHGLGTYVDPGDASGA